MRFLFPVFETLRIRLGPVWAVTVPKSVEQWTGASVGTVSVARTVCQVSRVFQSTVVFAHLGVSFVLAFAVACVAFILAILFASLRLIAPNVHTLVLDWWRSILAPPKARTSLGTFGIAGTMVDAN